MHRVVRKAWPYTLLLRLYLTLHASTVTAAAIAVSPSSNAALSSSSAIAPAPLSPPSCTLPSDYWQPKPSAICLASNDISYDSYTVVLLNWNADPRGCGRDVLDNLRGECGWITFWTCGRSMGDLGPNSSYELMTFSAAKWFAIPNCVGIAIAKTMGMDDVSAVDCS